MIKKTKYLLIIAISLLHGTATGMNLLKPYDIMFRPELVEDACMQFFAIGETGFAFHGYNTCNDKVNPLQIWQCDQNALAMLEGFPPNSPITQLREQIDASDDGTQGHVTLQGDLHYQFGLALGARFQLAHRWYIGIYCPFYVMSLKQICIADKSTDPEVRSLLTNNLAGVIERLGCLSFAPWRRAGAGDLTFLAEWEADFPQARPLLNNVHLFARLGISCPTGRKDDVNLIFALPYGYNGAASLPFGAGLILTGLNCFRFGGDVLLTYAFGGTRERRIKTARAQSDILLLQTAPTYIDWSLTQHFDIFAEYFSCDWGLTARLGYQFEKQGRNSLSFACNNLSVAIANTAASLDGWTSHQFVARLLFDAGAWFEDDWYIPRAMAYVRVPFNGKRAALMSAVGFGLSIDF